MMTPWARMGFCVRACRVISIYWLVFALRRVLKPLHDEEIKLPLLK